VAYIFFTLILFSDCDIHNVVFYGVINKQQNTKHLQTFVFLHILSVKHLFSPVLRVLLQAPTGAQPLDPAGSFSPQTPCIVPA